ncbi:MAG TPA: GIY-YIG nuclease family protein [Hydrogenophaga sp.]
MASNHNPWNALRPKAGPAQAHVTERRRRPNKDVPREDRRPCFVYLLVHATENRFKIGHSIHPLNRAKQLPEAECLSLQSSLVAKFPNTRRAVEVEQALHKALAGFRLHIETVDAGPWAGGTEWFAMGSLSHAVNLLSCTPQEGADGSDTQVYPAVGPDRHSLVRPVRYKQMRAQSLRVQAETANERSMQAIVQTLRRLQERVAVRWYPGLLPSMTPEGLVTPKQKECVRIKQLRNLWTEDAMSARFDVVSSDFWMFQTGKPEALGQRRSWITQINYCPFEPNTLELWVEDRTILKTLPASHRLLKLWEEVCEM